MSEILGILVHGDNHFIVAGPCPDSSTAIALTRQWSVIQIGAPPPIPGWTIRSKAYRENLAWAVVVPGESEHSNAVVELLAELAGRGIAVLSVTPPEMAVECCVIKYTS